MGEAVLSDHMAERFGDYGCLEPDSGEWLHSLWRQGNGADIFAFFEDNGLGELTAAPLLRRWKRFSETPRELPLSATRG
jgi:hypothetical protein